MAIELRFELAFPWRPMTWGIFACAYWPLIYLPWEILSSEIFCPFLKSGFCLLCIELWESLLQIQVSSHIYIVTIFSNWWLCLFIFLGGVPFEEQLLLILIKSDLLVILWVCDFCVLARKSLPRPELQRFSLRCNISVHSAVFGNILKHLHYLFLPLSHYFYCLIIPEYIFISSQKPRYFCDVIFP